MNGIFDDKKGRQMIKKKSNLLEELQQHWLRRICTNDRCNQSLVFQIAT